MTKKKKNNLRCNECGKMFSEEKQYIKHYRKKHPDCARGLYNAIGTVGDEFVDGFIKYLSDEVGNINRHNLNNAQRVKELTEINASLAYKHNQLGKAVNGIICIATNAAEAVEKEG